MACVDVRCSVARLVRDSDSPNRPARPQIMDVHTRCDVYLPHSVRSFRCNLRVATIVLA